MRLSIKSPSNKITSLMRAANNHTHQFNNNRTQQNKMGKVPNMCTQPPHKMPYIAIHQPRSNKNNS